MNGEKPGKASASALPVSKGLSSDVD
ncbi:uncharacterized protein METZ01_LOCUS119668 [marine metagenome]|uniref:Uncharacterized protein n=1 Tax=marine metagenome TaxID=408172 RepID=A0A381XPW5_9ZZZZ